MPVEKPQILTVSQLTRRVKDLLETEVSYVWVSGEISNWRVSPAGHAYFTLKDKDCQIDAVMFRGKLMKLKFGPENGLEIVAFGLITVYERRGNYQIICDEMHPKGVGALQLAFEKLKRKLEEEGLFDAEHKKPLPLLPRRIGIVTSPTGAAIRDILNVIHRRFANVHILLHPARVQGEEAAEEIVEGIRALEELGVDVMIVGRGGGSLEDLWPFNEEIVVRAIYAAKTPIISAVGHEIDFTLSDFVADMRAPTPSAAAELVVQEQEALVDSVRQMQRRLAAGLLGRVERVRNRLNIARSSFVFRRPEELVRQRRQQVDELRMRMENQVLEMTRVSRRRVDHAARSLVLLSPRNRVRRARDEFGALYRRLGQSGAGVVHRSRSRLMPLIAQLDALSPLAVLSRGYALVRTVPEKKIVRDAQQLAQGDRVEIRLGKGSATAAVEHI
ncbi:MAG: exodeoxyribonuclease VII large subunit, partial [Candidatus Hydrogenedentes bacterium]|nr:exodeoxyribonuclease VII large subunit [Candidatus Hydrogenedentota bacterium]